MTGRVWPSNSIVFFCGNTVETWGPDTLDRGMGGSEESVIYLSRELARRGYDVTVFNTRAVSTLDVTGTGAGSVVYRPNGEVDRRDRFNVFIGWRSPDDVRRVRARVRLVDLHDTTQAEFVSRAALHADRFMVKSRYHRDLYGRVPDRKFAVVGNGLVPEQFRPAEKEPWTVGYFSSYDRGLRCLLQMWPTIRQQVPEARLRVCYGWNILDAHIPYVSKLGDLKREIVARLDELGDHGVVEFGRVSHDELACIMARTQVWAYPTEFDEIHCLTALKVQQAGAWPVTTNMGALPETVRTGDVLDCSDIYTNVEQQKAFVALVVDALRNGKRSVPVLGATWRDVGKVWDAEIRRCLARRDRPWPARLRDRVGDAWVSVPAMRGPVKRWLRRKYRQLKRSLRARTRR